VLVLLLLLLLLGRLTRAVDSGNLGRARALLRLLAKKAPETAQSLQSLASADCREERKRVQQAADRERAERRQAAIAEWQTAIAQTHRSNVGRCIALVLARQKERVVVNCVRGPTSVEEDPQRVLSLARDYYCTLLTAPTREAGGEDRETRGTRGTRERQRERIELAGLAEKIRVAELARALAMTPSRKAPGPSGMIPEMLKSLPEEGVAILAGIYNQWLARGPDPEACETLIVLIPKKAEWSGSLDDLCPISLLEPVRRVFLILARRQCRAVAEHGLLRGLYLALSRSGCAATQCSASAPRSWTRTGPTGHCGWHRWTCARHTTRCRGRPCGGHWWGQAFRPPLSTPCRPRTERRPSGCARAWARLSHLDHQGDWRRAVPCLPSCGTFSTIGCCSASESSGG
jgi:hypothetical protein